MPFWPRSSVLDGGCTASVAPTASSCAQASPTSSLPFAMAKKLARECSLALPSIPDLSQQICDKGLIEGGEVWTPCMLNPNRWPDQGNVPMTEGGPFLELRPVVIDDAPLIFESWGRRPENFELVVSAKAA